MGAWASSHAGANALLGALAGALKALDKPERAGVAGLYLLARCGRVRAHPCGGGKGCEQSARRKRAKAALAKQRESGGETSSSPQARPDRESGSRLAQARELAAYRASRSR